MILEMEVTQTMLINRTKPAFHKVDQGG